jgi:predicted metal-dependent phosphoesterase TrpH
LNASSFLKRAGDDGGGRVDLHVHTVYSDSLYTPLELVDRAVDLELSGIAVTDHDSVDGIAETRELCRSRGIDFIPGVELSATYHDQEVHLLGYMVDHESQSFLRSLEMLKSERLKRTKRILKRLSYMGFDIDLDIVLALAGRGSVGRPHIAAALVEAGVVKTFGDAFRRFLAPGAAAYVPRYHLDLQSAFDIIKDAGGLTVLAHPGVLNHDHLIPDMVKLGVSGIEVAHPFHDPGDVSRYFDMVNQYGLIPTGGSDCHGPGRGSDALGVVTAPREVCELIRRAAAGRAEPGRDL